MYLKLKNNNYWALDIETDSLTPTVIWCVCVSHLGTNEERTFTNKEEFNAWLGKIGPDTVFVGHNIVSFDIPVLNSLWGCNVDIYTRCVDSLILSYLYNSALEGGHSLEAYGVRLKFPKGNFNDWSHYSEEMERYCKNDVVLAKKVYEALRKKMSAVGYSELSAEIEHKTRVLIDRQQAYGFYFDTVGAESLCRDLKSRQSDLTRQIQALFPATLQEVARRPIRRTKAGGRPVQYEKDLRRHTKVVDNPDGSYSCLDLVEFNIGSPKQRLEKLLELGWEPKSFTPKGNPKVDEDALRAFCEAPGGNLTEVQKQGLEAIAEWLVLQGRITMLAGNSETGSKGWIGNVSSDSRIHGRVLSCGASSRRMVHSNPNTANIPSPHKAKYGKECRALWGVEPGKGLCLVGVDASGLENVGLLHYLSDKHRKKAEETLNQKKPNDIHSLNARKLSELLGKAVDREWGSKTSYYATLYGARGPKIAQILKVDKQEGARAQEVLYRSVPGLKEVVQDAEDEWDRSGGRIRCIDGGFVVCPSKSAALNYRIQSLGAVVMKLAAIILREEADKKGLWYETCATIHDEWQMAALEKDANTLGVLACECITEAARRLAFRVPLSGEFRCGENWASTH